MNTTNLITTMAVAGQSHDAAADAKIAIAFWICINCILLSIFIVRLIGWLSKDTKQKLWDYLFWDHYGFDGSRMGLNIITFIFMCINGIVLLLSLTYFVAQLL